MTDPLTEAKNLVVQAQLAHTEFDAVSSLTLAVNILIGLIEGHRHSYNPGAKAIYDRDMVEYPVTGPMQARQ